MSSLRGVVKVGEALREIAASQFPSIQERLRVGAEEMASIWSQNDIPPAQRAWFDDVWSRLTRVDVPAPDGKINATVLAMTAEEAETIIRDLHELHDCMVAEPDQAPNPLP